jgi:hypothetical protein
MRFIWATFLIATTTVGWGQTSTKVYPTYTNTIFRKPFPSYLSEKKSDGSVWLYRTYTNTIFRKPFPEYIVQKDTVYRTYSNTIIRKPFPIGKIDEGEESP